MGRAVRWKEEDGEDMLWVCPTCDSHLNADCVAANCPICGAAIDEDL